MINSINANSINSVSLNQYKNSELKVSTSSEEVAATSTMTVQNGDSTVSTSKDGDTLTISGNSIKAGKTFQAQSANRASQNVSTDEGFESAGASAMASAAASVGIDSTTSLKQQTQAASAAVNSGSSGSSSSSSTSSDNLSSYTESELKQMLEEGEITRAEYDAEIASRSEGDTSEEDSEETDNMVNSTERNVNTDTWTND